jgi:hypothetical protein
MPADALNPETLRLRRRMVIATCLAEAIVVPATAWTAFRLAGGDLAIAAPLLAVSALEACRIPLSSYATRLKPTAKLTAVAALAGIAMLTGEVMTVGFSSLLAARLAPVTEATSARDAARDHLAAERASLDRLTVETAGARAALVELSAHPPALAEVRSQTCASRHGRTYDCTPASALRANAATQTAYDDRLRRAQEAAGDAERRVRAAPSLKDAEAALQASEARLEAAKAANPMARLVVGLSDTELNRVRSLVAVSLGFAIAVATSLMAYLAHLEPRGTRPSKLACALRATMAATRKRLRRIEPTIVTQFRDRTVYVHVPVSPDGVVLDVPPKIVDPRRPRAVGE